VQVKIGFSTSNSAISGVIRAATKAKCSHTYIVFDDIPLVGHEVYQALWDGFNMGTRAHVGDIVCEVAVDVDPASALAICRKWLGTPYDYLGLVGEAPVQVGRMFGQRWPNELGGVHHMFCSEAATYMLQYAPMGNSELKAALLKLDPRATSPQDLLEALTG
jgi:hypothetical protein